MTFVAVPLFLAAVAVLASSILAFGKPKINGMVESPCQGEMRLMARRESAGRQPETVAGTFGLCRITSMQSP